MFNTDELVIEKIQSYELWAEVPRYERLDVVHCVLCLIPNRYDSIRKYLKRRKGHNKRYKEFWSNADKVIFNNDRSMYRVAIVTKLADE